MFKRQQEKIIGQSPNDISVCSSHPIASPLTHTIFSSIWGYKIGIAKILRQPLFLPAVSGLILASFAHGLFDFLNLTTVLRIEKNDPNMDCRSC
jgi:RsiW-degrading membrane proteinase PrsW (M82 family)